MTRHASLAAIIDNAELMGAPVDQLTGNNPDIDVRSAYAIQQEVLERRLARGERRVGLKLGLTSRAKMLQVNVNEVIVGSLTDVMQVEDGGEISAERLIHPRIEPEVAFVLGRDLPARIDLCRAAAAVEAVAPALEIIDSRYIDFRFNLTDVVADNCSASRFVLGAPSRLDAAGIANLGLALTINGRVAAVGSTAAILGHPLRALVEAARICGEIGMPMKAGDVVLAGAATAAVDVRSGCHYALDMAQLGRVSVSVV